MVALELASAAMALTLLQPQAAPDTPPKMVSTSPISGAVVRAGQRTIRVRFDQPMRGDSWSFTTVDGVEYPDCDEAPRRLPDGRSFELTCRLQAGRSYALGFNGGRFRNFRGVNGVPAEAAILRFRTE